MSFSNTAPSPLVLASGPPCQMALASQRSVKLHKEETPSPACDYVGITDHSQLADTVCVQYHAMGSSQTTNPSLHWCHTATGVGVLSIAMFEKYPYRVIEEKYFTCEALCISAILRISHICCFREVIKCVSEFFFCRQMWRFHFFSYKWKRLRLNMYFNMFFFLPVCACVITERTLTQPMKAVRGLFRKLQGFKRHQR